MRAGRHGHLLPDTAHWKRPLAAGKRLESGCPGTDLKPRVCAARWLALKYMLSRALSCACLKAESLASSRTACTEGHRRLERRSKQAGQEGLGALEKQTSGIGQSPVPAATT